MSAASLNGHACSAARVQCGDWGTWWVDCNLTEPEAIAAGAAATVLFAGATLVGTVVSGGAIDGRAAYRIVGGAGGWGRELAPKAYASDGGIQISTVITDAAREAGESVEGLPTGRLGPHYARARDAASSVLSDLALHAWRVDFDGITRFGARPTVAYAGDGARTRRELGPGIYEVTTESVAGLLPGVTIDGSAPATDVEYTIDADRLVVKVWAGSRGSRFLGAFGRVLDALHSDVRYRGAYEFRIVSQSGERLNLQPVRLATGLPALSRVPVRAGMAGLKATHLPGSLCVVQFLDADPSRPIVTGFDAPDAPGWMPLVLELGGPGALGVARLGDTVQAGPYSGIITGASARVKAAL